MQVSKGVIRIDDRQIGNVLPLRTPEFTWGTGSLRQLPSLQGNLDGSCETAWLLMNSYWKYFTPMSMTHISVTISHYFRTLIRLYVIYDR